MHDCKNELKEIALRATPARVAILQLLESANDPMDANAITEYLRKKNIETDPATVFRIMNAFTQKGITTPIQFQEGKTRYELANKEHHHHLICETCGKIETIEDKIIPPFEKHIAKEHGFIVKRHALEFFGVCRNCKQ